MPTPHLDAIGLVVSDLGRSIAFYRALGCAFDDPTPEDHGHIEFALGNVRLMIDAEEAMRSFDPDWTGTAGGRVILAARCESPAEVDRLHDELAAIGSGSHRAPFDAFFGNRYATVLDPDGVHVDLYAPLEG